MRILVLGAGALGSYDGARLIEAGAELSSASIRPCWKPPTATSRSACWERQWIDACVTLGHAWPDS